MPSHRKEDLSELKAAPVPVIAGCGVYETIVIAATKYAPPGEHVRITGIRDVLASTPSLRDGAGEHLDLSRLLYAAYLLSGQSMLRVLAATDGGYSGYAGREGEIDGVLDWKRFEFDPGSHHAMVSALSRPLPGFRDRILSMLHAVMSCNREVVTAEIGRLMLEYGALDAAGGRQMVDVAVACLLPPISDGDLLRALSPKGVE